MNTSHPPFGIGWISPARCHTWHGRLSRATWNSAASRASSYVIMLLSPDRGSFGRRDGWVAPTGGRLVAVHVGMAGGDVLGVAVGQRDVHDRAARDGRRAVAAVAGVVVDEPQPARLAWLAGLRVPGPAVSLPHCGAGASSAAAGVRD